MAEYFGVEEHRLRFYTSEAASSLVLSRSYSATVEQVVKFDTKPGVTGICDLCPRVNLDDVLDMEDYGREPRFIKPKATKRPSKRYKQVDKQAFFVRSWLLHHHLNSAYLHYLLPLYVAILRFVNGVITCIVNE